MPRAVDRRAWSPSSWRYGSRTLLPSAEAAYPWLLALLATSLFSGFGVARRLAGGDGAARDAGWRAGSRSRCSRRPLPTIAFATVAVANDLALRDTAVASSRFGPTPASAEPPPCDGPLAAGASARLTLHLSATVDLRPLGIGRPQPGCASGSDFRWLAYVATSRQLGPVRRRAGRRRGMDRRAGHGWRTTGAARSQDDQVDAQALEAALTPGYRATAEDRGLEVIEGARARRCRIAVDGEVFARGLPAGRAGSSASTDLHRWRGQLDYWVFPDGELGQVAGSAQRRGVSSIEPDALLGTIDVRLTATERGRDTVIYPPGP